MISNHLNSNGSKLAVGIGVGILSATIALIYFYRQKLLNTPPKKWRRVGEISDIICYPIKSCAPIRISTIHCDQMSLHDGNLRDRVFMITDLEGKFITARAYPTLVQVQPTISGDKMTLSAPGMLDLELNFSHLYTIPIEWATVWYEQVQVIDCGEEAAKWFSRFIISEDTGFRLMFYPNTTPTRNCAKIKPQFKKLSQPDSGSLQDFTGYMMINEGSIMELNSRLDHTVTPQQFRPNFVVKGAMAFEEDNWQWVKIGKETIFRNIKDCTRCIFTNIDPQTGLRNAQFQPLKTLREYRQIVPDESPVMGIHLGVRQLGNVSLGDAVFVECTA